MPTRPLPPSPKLVPCADCSGKFSLQYDEAGTPTAFHTLPYCAAFTAIGTVVDAISHSEKCRMALKPP